MAQLDTPAPRTGDPAGPISGTPPDTALLGAERGAGRGAGAAGGQAAGLPGQGAKTRRRARGRALGPRRLGLGGFGRRIVFAGLLVVLIVVVGCFGDPWFTWWVHLPGKPIYLPEKDAYAPSESSRAAGQIQPQTRSFWAAQQATRVPQAQLGFLWVCGFLGGVELPY